MHAEQNYIYIVLAILYIIYSIVKASKKAGQQKPVTNKSEPSSTVHPPTSSPVPEPENDFKKMLQDLLGGDSEINIPEKHPDSYREQQLKPEPVKIKHPPAKIITYDKKVKAVPSHFPSKTKEKVLPLLRQSASQRQVRSSAKDEAKSFLSGEKPAPKKVFTEAVVEEESDTDSYREDFDIRQAIIYSEILKRPQY